MREMDQAEYLLHYMKMSQVYVLKLGGTGDLQGYVDTGGANKASRKSIGGYALYCGDSLVSWQSKHEVTVARSTQEAEYQAVGEATREAMYLFYL
jgi:hypothetical protein